MTHFVVVRHGETRWNLEQRMQGHFDSPLTAVGRAQAEAIARRLAAETRFGLLVASDLGRARDTARAIGAATGHEVLTDARLRERHWGAGEGLTYAEIAERYPDAFRPDHEVDPDYAVPGGESRRAFFARAAEAFAALTRAHPAERIIVVTHGGVVAALWRHIHRIPIAAAHRVAIGNASYNAVSFEAGAWTVHAWDDANHLPDATPFEEA